MGKLIKKGMILTMVLALCLSMALPATAATTYYKDPALVSGRDYTTSQELAAKLDQIFAGDAGLYTNSGCTATASFPLGTRLNNGAKYYLKNNTTGAVTYGWQCYVYANAVYNRLFNEIVSHGESLDHSEVVIPGGASTVSYEMFAQAGVVCGAYIRTTANSSGSFNGSAGHSMIILGYDAETITYLEGNGDGYGMVQVMKRDWASFNRALLTNKGRVVCHVIQPTRAYYQSLYPSHSYGSDGSCGDCGEVYDWAATLSQDCAGTYQVTQDCTPRTDMPYEGAYQALTDLRAGQTVEVTGQYINAFGQTWYQVSYGQFQIGYVPRESLLPQGVQPLEVTCDNFSPADQAVLEKKSNPVIGTVVSNYPLKAIYGYLDGEFYTSWTASNETTQRIELRGTAINADLSFSTLADGKHTLKLVAMSYAHTTPATIVETVFYMVGDEDAGKIPGKPSLTGLKSQYAAGEPVAFTWSAVTNATHYELLLSAKDGQGQWSEPETVATTSGMTKALGAGEYRAVLRAYNSAVPQIHTDSAEYQFSVLEPRYTVRFDPNGGTRVPASQIKVHGQALALTAEVPQREGYTFLGWALDPQAAQADYQPGVTYTADADITLYALWEADQVPLVVGDINGDGKVNTADVAKLYAHVRKTVLIGDEAVLARCDINGDGKVNTADVAKLYAIVRKTI